MKFLFQLRRFRKHLGLVIDSFLIRSHDLFDKEWYLENNPDVAQAKLNPLYHYLMYGGFEGRNPGPSFYSRWYLDTYDDVRKAGLNPLIHYLRYGRKEGRESSPQFHQTEEAINMDLSLIRASGFFDEISYLENNPDVAQAKMDPLLHYLLYGGREGRNLAPYFYSKWYLNNYEDVKNSGMNPLVHYLKYGREQARRTKPWIFKLSGMYDYSQKTNKLVFEDVPERIYLKCPRVLGSFSGTLNEGEAACPRPYISLLEDAIIFGGASFVLSKEEIFLDDELVDFSSAEFGKKSSFVKLLPENSVMFENGKEPRLHIKEGILLSCGHDTNYFHWLIECLPKLLLIDDLNLYNDTPLIIPKGLHKNLLAALNRININNRQLIEIEPNSPCLVEQLIFPSALSRIVDRYEGSPIFNVDIVLSHKWLTRVSECLKSTVNYDKSPWRKIFLTRRKGLRAVGNLKELELMLLRQGFDIIELEGVSLEYQLELFSEASIIVAPTGAALTNMLFCQPGTKVIILMSNHETTNFYFWSNLGAVNNLDLTTIAGQRLFKLTDYWSVHDDYIIDSKLLLEEIKSYE